jgi:hypothetical protein
MLRVDKLAPVPIYNSLLPRMVRGGRALIPAACLLAPHLS